MDSIKNKVELVAPAGDLERLSAAFDFGADAVYLGGKQFSLRAQSDNFTYDELKAAALKAHFSGKKIYIALNIYPYDSDFEKIHDFVEYLTSIFVDGVIVSDIGLISYLRNKFPKLNIHVSTQANITNSQSARMYSDLGVKRIVLARELSLSQIRYIRDSLPDTVKLEAFVHGAMCMAYSGRCMLSAFMTGRSANRGECTQSCRWEYDISECSRDEHFAVSEDSKGTYVFSSRDLNCISFLDKLRDAGVDAFKIEGRTKSVYYVANTVNAYRRAINILENSSTYKLNKKIVDELDKASNRGYTTGFYLGEPLIGSNELKNGYTFVAIAITDMPEGTLVEMRNKFAEGDTLEVLSPFDDNFNRKIIVETITDDATNERLAVVKDVCRRVVLNNVHLHAGDILRRQPASKPVKKQAEQ